MVLSGEVLEALIDARDYGAVWRYIDACESPEGLGDSERDELKQIYQIAMRFEDVADEVNKTINKLLNERT